MTNKLLLDEIKQLHKKQIEQLFHELFSRMKTHSHWFSKPTYSIEMTFSEWYDLQKQYLGDD